MADKLPATRGMEKKKSLPYWLSGGTEACELCTHAMVLEMTRRCAACDRPACEHCVSVDRDTGEVLCHECVDEEEDG